MENFKIKINVFKNQGDGKSAVLKTVQQIIDGDDDDCEIAVIQSAGRKGTPILEEFFSNLGFNMDSSSSAEEILTRKDILKRTGNTKSLIPRKNLHFRLFNCDHTYNLDKVEVLIRKVTTKLSRETKIEKTYFSLPQMGKLCKKLEDEGEQPGCAVFVVHAHESNLMINMDNGVGYSKLYRTLVRVTGDQVLIVIGGDDNYKDREERDKSVLSRWALNKICSHQFKSKYINGEKSFIFSWEDSHNPIHEEALEFYLDPKNKGQEFVPRPKPPPPTVVVPQTVEQPQGQEFVPLQKTLPSLELPKAEEPKSDLLFLPEKEPHMKEMPKSSKKEVHKTSHLHVLSFYSKTESVHKVEQLLVDVYTKLGIPSNPHSPYLVPNDFPQHIKVNKPDTVVLVSDMKDFKNVQYLENWVQLYQDIFESIAVDGKRLIFVVCGDYNCKPGSFTSDLVQEKFFKINSGILAPSKLTIMSWSGNPNDIHKDALLQLLSPSHRIKKDESRASDERAEPVQVKHETEAEKGLLRYRAVVKYGSVRYVLKTDPLGWEPEEVLLQQLLEKNKEMPRFYLEFWESKDSNITAVVTETSLIFNTLDFMYRLGGYGNKKAKITK